MLAVKCSFLLFVFSFAASLCGISLGLGIDDAAAWDHSRCGMGTMTLWHGIDLATAWDRSRCGMGSFSLRHGINDAVAWDRSGCGMGSMTLWHGIDDAVAWDRSRFGMGSITLWHGIDDAVAWDRSRCGMGSISLWLTSQMPCLAHCVVTQCLLLLANIYLDPLIICILTVSCASPRIFCGSIDGYG